MAKDGIILYSSKTGYSKRYAEYLAEELDYTIKPIQKANLFNVSCYPVVIYGGGLKHNRIDGLRGIIDGFKYLGDQTLIIFSAGLASLNDDLIKQIKAHNFPEFMSDAYVYQPLPGGLHRKDCEGNGPVAKEVALYLQKRDEHKKLTRGDKLALAIAEGQTPDQDRFDTSACATIIQAARCHV
ncbi:MAG: hypothetical protein IKE43_04545 [Coriobacteriales bacterium]|nr:hypothetical protein [Coriobacteriales bacterium]